MTNRDRIQWLLLAVSGLAFIPFAEWQSVTPFGTMLLQSMASGYVFFVLAALIGIPCFAIRLIFYPDRWNSAFYLSAFIVAFAATMGGILLGQSIRMNGMKSFTQRSKPLIAAIRQYEKDHGTPPPSLESLVPKYLSGVPWTGMMAYPEYKYHTGGTTPATYGGNQWVLIVHTSSGPVNFDEMLYFPNKIYPKHGYGGGLQPVGDWAYVHE